MLTNQIKRYLFPIILRKNRLLLSLNRIKRVSTPNAIKAFGVKKSHVFFGYYDVNPFHPEKNILLASKCPANKKVTPKTTPLTIGYFDLDNSKFFDVDITKSWCWQQGCRLQWYPRKDSNLILYNNFVDGKYICTIQDVFSRKIRQKTEKPIYSISEDGRWGLSINFSRLERLRPGYGYSNLPDYSKDDHLLKNDGVWLIDMESGTHEFLFSINDMAEDNHHSMHGAQHYYNHLLFHPIRNEFIFFHIWQKMGKRFIRLMKTDLNCSTFSILIDFDYGISHFNWKSENELIVYLIMGPAGRGYYYLHYDSGSLSKINGFIHDLDGHPTVSSNNEFIITDTVPNKYSERKLVYFDTSSQKSYIISQFFSPYKYRFEKRCDLHPRLHTNKNLVCIDSAHEGRRSIYVINLNEIDLDDYSSNKLV